MWKPMQPPSFQNLGPKHLCKSCKFSTDFIKGSMQTLFTDN